MSQPPPPPPPPRSAPHKTAHARSIFAVNVQPDAPSPPTTRGSTSVIPAPHPPPSTFIAETDEKVTAVKAGSALRADEVVAAGARPQELQLPSPVYGAAWVDEHHVFVAAGGGGRRFGMSNLVVLLDVHTSTQANSGHTTRNDPEDGRNNGQRAIGEPPLWRFVSALDLDADVPWCTSCFLPYDSSMQALTGGQRGGDEAGNAAYWSAEQQHTLHGLLGFIAVSSITCFYLVGVFRAEAAAECVYSLRRLARVSVPSDERNPDKKSIALVHHAVLIAHDECGVLLYDLATLLAAQGTEGDPATRIVCPALAEWRLPARVNDLHANRVHLVRTKLARPLVHGNHSAVLDSFSSGTTWSASVPQKAGDGQVSAHNNRDNRSMDVSMQEGHASTSASAGSGGAARCVALVLDYVLVAATLQDKTLRIGIFRLAHHHKPRCALATNAATERVVNSVVNGPARALHRIAEVAVLTGATCGLSFALMPSSLRLVRLFALEDMTAAAETVSRKRLALRSLKRQQAQHSTERLGPHAAPVSTANDETDDLMAGLVLVAYDTEHGESYIVQARVTAQLTATATPSADDATPGRGGDDVAGKWYDVPRVSVRVQGAKPLPVVKDCITCLSPCAYTEDEHDKSVSAAASSAAGMPALPRAWLAGTVEGWVVLLSRHIAAGDRDWRRGEPARYVLKAVRPSPHRRIAAHAPALHKEPVSALAVSARNDVVTGDIAQHIVLSTVAPHMQRANSVAALELFPDLGSHGCKVGGLSGCLSSTMLRGLLVAVVALLLILYLQSHNARDGTTLQPAVGT